jgi:hypothetical protein
MYSYKGSTPAPLPERIRLSDGMTRTDKSTFTDAEIADAGYVYVDSFTQNYEERTQKVVWNSGLIAWELLDKTHEEIADYDADMWETVRTERNELLQASDVDIIKELEASGAVSQPLKDYRQALRDLPQTQELYSITWPTKPE